MQLRCCFSLLLPLYGDEFCYRAASADSKLQTTLCTGSQGYKTNNRGRARVCVSLRVAFCAPVLGLMGNRGEERDGRGFFFIGEGDGESVRIAWWRTDPAVMAAYKLSYYIMRPGQ